MVQADGAVGRGRCAEVLEIGAYAVGKLGAEPLVKTLYIGHFFHDLHADGGAEQLRLRLLLALDLDDPCRLASLIGQQAELGDKARDGAQSSIIPELRLQRAPRTEFAYTTAEDSAQESTSPFAGLLPTSSM